MFIGECFWSGSCSQVGAVAGFDVRLQWDLDHGASGAFLERRSIKVGLRGDVLAGYAREWLLGVEDISDFMADQKENAATPYEPLIMPSEDVYPVADVVVARRLGVSRPEGGDQDG